LREGKWQAEERLCAFHCGNPGQNCGRCRSSWYEHFGNEPPEVGQEPL
jgi:hypothetical protein